VSEWGQPVKLVTVARQIAFPSGVGYNMPWPWSTLHDDVVRWDAIDALGHLVRSQLARDCLAHQPYCILGEPAVGGFGLVQFQLVFEQVAQPLDQLVLERVLGRGHRARGIAAQLLGDRGAVCPYDQLAQRPGVLALPGQ